MDSNKLYQINNIICDDDGSKLSSNTDMYVASLSYPTLPSGKPLTIKTKEDSSIVKINIAGH